VAHGTVKPVPVGGTDEQYSGQFTKVSTTCVYGLGEISERGVKKKIAYFFLLLVRVFHSLDTITTHT
jgi:hypothetical protein